MGCKEEVFEGMHMIYGGGGSMLCLINSGLVMYCISVTGTFSN